MCHYPSNLHSRLDTIRHKGGCAYENFILELSERERFIVRLLFELEVGWKDTVYLLAFRDLEEERAPAQSELEVAQKLLVSSLGDIRTALDRDHPADFGK